MTITLKDKDNADVVYTLKSVQGSTAIFQNGTNLLAKSRLTLQLIERDKTNRVIGKLSIPTVSDCSDTCVDPRIAYTEVGSFDLSSVLIAGSDEAENFIAQFSSLVSNAAVSDMFTNGELPV